MALHRSGILETGIKIGLIANRVKTTTNYHQVQQELLKRIQLPFLGSLRDTQNYIKAMAKGQTIFDLLVSQAKTAPSQWQPIVDWLSFLAGSARYFFCF